MNLSDHFTLAEMTASDTAARQGISNQPSDQETDNLRRLCVEILEPLRRVTGKPIRITSGYRCPLLNTIVGGAKMSAHTLGRAADIKVDGLTPLEVCRLIQELGLPYDQVIHEFKSWCHVAIAPDSRLAKREALTAVKLAGFTRYDVGLV